MLSSKNKNQKQLICVVGPTAVGKTKVGVELAKHFNTVVVNADSRQIYKEISIGTAKPTLEEQDGVTHYLIDHISIHQNYTVADYEKEALDLLEKLFKNHDKVILVGGSGLFVNALCFGLDEMPEIKDEVRNQVRELYENNGVEAVTNKLQSIKIDALEGLDIENPHRVMRALEVLLSSGETIQSFQNKPKKQRLFDSVFIGINMDREALYSRINQRVLLMMENGLEEEVQSLKEYQKLPSLKTVGYQEFFEAYEKGFNLDWVINQIQQSSRRYAKRQITWFKKTPNLQWFSPIEISKIIEFLKFN